MDSYQAIYDATRSRISNGDVGRAISDVAFNAFDISHTKAILQQEFLIAAYEMQRPSVLYRPQIMLDGTAWCALYGDNLQDGVAGFGDTPAQAMDAFDQAWLKQRTPRAVQLAKATEDGSQPLPASDGEGAVGEAKGIPTKPQLPSGGE